MTGITTDFFSTGILTVMFDRPSKKNAITQEMMNTVISKLISTATNDEVKVVVLTGAAGFFSCGVDFFDPAAAKENDPNGRLNTFQKFVAALIDYPKPLVAIVTGPAIGMACTSLALCDVVYASDRAYFQTPFTQLGLVPEGCSTYTFPRIFGLAKAAKLLYLNEAMSAQEAAQYGFVTQVFPHQELMPKSLALVKELASLPLESLMVTKELVRGRERAELHEVNRQEVEQLVKRSQSMDFITALTDPETFKKIKNKL